MTLEPGRWTNPKMLSWAREQMGLSLQNATEHAAKRFKRVREGIFSFEDIVAWEHGVKDPTLQDLELLAEIYDCPVGYFFLKSPPREAGLQLSFRGLAPDKAQRLGYETRRGLKRFQRLVEYAGRLTTELGLPTQVRIAARSVNEDVKTVVRNAVRELGVTPEVRASWNSALEAFEGWRAAIERQGFLVFAVRLDPRDVRGACIAPEFGPPAILVNHADAEAATGRTFTLLHEYAHLVIKHSGRVCDFRGQEEGAEIEPFANRFAAEAIVPEEEFSTLLQDRQLHYYKDWWSDASLDALREPFKASRDVVAILLRELQLAPPDFYQRKREVWERRRPFGRGGGGGGKTLVYRRFRELGSAFSKLLAEAERREVISNLDVADLLDTNVNQASSFLASARSP